MYVGLSELYENSCPCMSVQLNHYNDNKISESDYVLNSPKKRFLYHHGIVNLSHMQSTGNKGNHGTSFYDRASCLCHHDNQNALSQEYNETRCLNQVTTFNPMASTGGDSHCSQSPNIFNHSQFSNHCPRYETLTLNTAADGLSPEQVHQNMATQHGQSEMEPFSFNKTLSGSTGPHYCFTNRNHLSDGPQQHTINKCYAQSDNLRFLSHVIGNVVQEEVPAVSNYLSPIGMSEGTCRRLPRHFWEATSDVEHSYKTQGTDLNDCVSISKKSSGSEDYLSPFSDVSVDSPKEFSPKTSSHLHKHSYVESYDLCESTTFDQPPSLSSHFSQDSPGPYSTVSLSESPTSSISGQTSDTGSIQVKNKTTISCNSIGNSCQVCGEKSAGFHCGAFVCEACKKFFIRSAKRVKKLYKCLKNEKCVVTKKLRTLCQYCRYQKCLKQGMYKPGEFPASETAVSVIPCRVCEAPSSGYHFGALTCEGCKGFFRRMIKEREVTRYSCIKDGNCKVTQTTRNTCKACRYQNCLLAGMSADGSRIGRQPNAVKHATQLEMQSCIVSSSSTNKTQQRRSDSTKTKKSGDQKHILDNCSCKSLQGSKSCVNCLQQGYSNRGKMDCAKKNNIVNNRTTSNSNMAELPEEHYSVSEGTNDLKSCTSVACLPRNGDSLPVAESELDIFYHIVRAGLELEGLNTRSPDLVELQLDDFKDMDSCWKNLMTQFTTYAHKILNFAKKIPGYRTLKLDDQASLLRTAMYPIIVLSHSRDYNPESRAYNYFNFTERERDLIFHFIPGFIPLREHFFRMGEMVTSLSIDPREYEYLYAILLLSPDEGNILEQNRVLEVQENLAASFQEYEERNYKDGGTRFGVLLARLAEFRMINLQHQQIVASVIKKHPSFQVPQLFSELFLNS